MDCAKLLWGQFEDGRALDQTFQTPLLAESVPFLAHSGVQPGASLSIADAALVTQDHLAALGDPWCIIRFPTP